MDDIRPIPETSLPPLRDGGQSPAGMTAEDRERWMAQTRLQQLFLAEAKAWKRLTWGVGVYFGLLLLVPLGVMLAGDWLHGHVVPADPSGVWVVGMVLQGIGGTAFWLLAIPLLLRFVRWVEAMWRRRQFSSTCRVGPGQPR